MVVHVIAHQPKEMGFVQSDYMVQDLAAATPYPTLRNAILPWGLHTRPLGFQSRRVQKRDDAVVELRISVQNHVAVWTGFWKSLTQLLHDPLGIRMSSDVEVEDLAASVLNHEEAVEQLER